MKTNEVFDMLTPRRLAALALLLVPAAWAAAPPPPPGLRTPAAPIAGALVVCGGGGTPDSVRQRFVELAGGKKARLVVVPSASALAPSERSLDPWKKAGVASAVLLHARDRT